MIMDNLKRVFRICLTYVLTIYYSFKVGVYLFAYTVMHPFEQLWKSKLRVEPPECLSNPKYGVHKYVKVNDIKIHYVESGDPSKELILLIHGFPEFWYSWRHQIVDFSRDYWVVAYDQRGYGDSEKPTPVSEYAFDKLVHDANSLIQALGRDKCTVVAHDWGCMVAWRLRALFPERVRAFVALGGAGSEPWRSLLWSDWDQLAKSWYVFFFQVWWLPEILMTFNDMQVLDHFIKGQSGGKVTDSDMECYKYLFGKPNAMTFPINYYRANFSSSLPTRVQQPLPMPCLHILGDKDEFLTAQLLDETKKWYPNVENVLMKDTQHFIQQEKPEELNLIIREFFKTHSI